SEQWTFKYEYKDGSLQKVPVHYDIPAWSPQEVQDNLQMLAPILEAGGTSIGAFQEGRLVGMAVLGNRFLGENDDLLQMAFLYVSLAFRRKGIAKRLMDEMCSLAKQKGANGLYISATESGSAVGFYLDYGCKLATVLDPELFAREPEDIHLVLHW
ncbi:MAG: GNAT family N-acetyltransferase, partial [Clostridia bacterium]